jgi:hypothetical protein
VVQVLPLEHNPRTDSLAEARGFGERRWATHELGEEGLELGPECSIPAGRVIESGQLVERRDEGLWYVAATVWAETAFDRSLR